MLARAVDPEQLSLEKLLVRASEEPFVDSSVKLAGKGSHEEFCYFYDSMNSGFGSSD